MNYAKAVRYPKIVGFDSRLTLKLIVAYWIRKKFWAKKWLSGIKDT